jgi:hypothetical protein
MVATYPSHVVVGRKTERDMNAEPRNDVIGERAGVIERRDRGGATGCSGVNARNGNRASGGRSLIGIPTG